MRRFPIQRAGTIPWEDAEKAYAFYVHQFGTCQSLERLAERGGFGILEFCSLYLGFKNYQLQDPEIAQCVIAKVAATLGNKWEFPQK
jgi:hypothetical protein